MNATEQKALLAILHDGDLLAAIDYVEGACKPSKPEAAPAPKPPTASAGVTTVNTKALKHAVALVKKAADAKAANPLYGMIRVEAEAGGLTLAANDMDVAARIRIPATVAALGVVLVNGAALADVVKGLRGTETQLALGSRALVVDGMPLAAQEDKGGDFALPVVEGEPDVVILAEHLSALIAGVRFAISRVQDTRFATEGILFERSGTELVAVGTDGRRLARMKRAADWTAPKARAVLLPDGLDLLAAYLKKAAPGASVACWLHGNRAGFVEGPDVTIWTRTLAGEFPNYDNVIPKGPQAHNARFNPADAVAALEQLKAYYVKEAPVVRVEFDPEGARVVFHAEREGLGAASAEVSAEVSGPALKTAFNPYYLTEGLKAATEGAVTMHQARAVVLARFDIGDQHSYTVMPLSLLA